MENLSAQSTKAEHSPEYLSAKVRCSSSLESEANKRKYRKENKIKIKENSVFPFKHFLRKSWATSSHPLPRCCFGGNNSVLQRTVNTTITKTSNLSLAAAFGGDSHAQMPPSFLSWNWRVNLMQATSSHCFELPKLCQRKLLNGNPEAHVCFC